MEMQQSCNLQYIYQPNFNKNTVYCKYMNLVTIYKTYIHISMMDSLTISAVIKKNIFTFVPYICI